MRMSFGNQLGFYSLVFGVSVFASFSGCGGSKMGDGGTGAQLTVMSLAIGPTDVNVKQQQQLTATATFSDGSKVAVTPQSWSSSNSQALTISASGIATGVSFGQSTVSATFSGVTGSAAVNIHGGTLSITVSGAVTGTVTIAASGGFNTSVTASQTLQVPPGNFTITGNSANSGNSRYFPAIRRNRCQYPMAARRLLRLTIRPSFRTQPKFWTLQG